MSRKDNLLKELRVLSERYLISQRNQPQKNKKMKNYDLILSHNIELVLSFMNEKSLSFEFCIWNVKFVLF